MEFKRYDLVRKLNDRTIIVNIVIRVTEESFPVGGEDFDFGSPQINNEYLKRFESGELFNANVFVTATAHGLEGIDSLGGCHIYTNNMYDSSKFNSDVEDVVETHGMVKNALDDLFNQVRDRANQLALYSDVGSL